MGKISDESINNELIESLKNMEPMLYINSNKKDLKKAFEDFTVKEADMYEAQERLIKFAPLIEILFQDEFQDEFQDKFQDEFHKNLTQSITQSKDQLSFKSQPGIIESPLVEISKCKKAIEKLYNKEVKGRLFLKCDSHLQVAGSVKARGGIYEVLKHAEELAIMEGLLKGEQDYSILASEEFRKFFSKYRIEVGSTGNLGLSIGIMSRALGFKAVIHMSKDAKEWKKALLREKGAEVIEYESEYGEAVKAGRERCKNDPCAYFIDDENSKDLFAGYSTAALRLKSQLLEKGINLDTGSESINLYLPCGVGGAPGGITFGAKTLFKNKAYCYFAEPTHAPCMLLGLLTKKSSVHVRDYDIDGHTAADGLAVGSPSKLVLSMAKDILDGEYTIDDKELYMLQALLYETEGIKIEPSATASLKGAALGLGDNNTIHIAWATGGLLLPQELFLKDIEKGIELLKGRE